MEKDYKKIALDLAEILIGKAPETRKDVEEMLPELRESEDEMIRKALLNYLIGEFDKKGNESWDYDFHTTDIIAWLEKQGEKKLVDKVEPKFHKGDWVVYDHKPYQVVELPKEGYINLGLKGNGKIEFAPSTYCRLWTIQDAKDGDMIYVSTEEKGIQAIFKSYDDNYIYFHCYLCQDFNVDGWLAIGDIELIYPLQKIHYNSFFQKMKEAGYEWDTNEKNLKKIEQKPTEWSEEDEACYISIMEHLKESITNGKPETYTRGRLTDWIDNRVKSLRPQWKPSEEQMDALDFAADCIVPDEFCYKKKYLKSLLTDLNKLRG